MVVLSDFPTRNQAIRRVARKSYHGRSHPRQEECCPNGDPDLCARPPIKIFLGWHWSFYRTVVHQKNIASPLKQLPLPFETLLLGCTICGCTTSLGTAILTPAQTLRKIVPRMSRMDTLMPKLARACEKL